MKRRPPVDARGVHKNWVRKLWPEDYEQTQQSYENLSVRPINNYPLNNSGNGGDKSDRTGNFPR